MRLGGPAIASLLLALPGCEDRQDPPPDLYLAIAEKGTDCLVEANGRPFRIPAENDAFQAFLGDGQGRRALLRQMGETSYRCFGNVLFAVQRAGFEPNWVAEPPP